MKAALLLALLLAAGAALRGARADIAQGEDTSVAKLASHDGMLLFNGALRAAVPPNATDPRQSARCPCSDAAPRDTSSGKPPFLVSIDCFGQALYGNCNASFMQARVALEVAQPPLLDLLSRPGWAGTLLVPTDAAFDAALAAHPAVMRDPALLQQVLKFHMLPPEPRTQGLWTTPFMATGAKLWTAYDGPAPLQSTRQPLPAGTTAAGGMTGVRLTAPGGSARVVGPSDVGACKAYLTVVDAVLLPWSPAELAALASVPPTAGSGAPLGAALSSGGGAATNATDGAATDGTSGAQCVLQANTVFNATTLAPGASNRQRSVGECCAACRRTSNCNSFQYCAQKGGCRFPDGSASLPFGWCQLVHSGEVASGQGPTWVGWNATTPVISGYTASAPTAPSPAAGRRLLVA
ncbi:hypothetical protein COHA_006864 [Chlorella ohadii]|uniref:FAS1 domain-containing protein n=1 Tax=Chlorella ohadii TaxID=2649997 RepID=A0AAD5H3H3_9CHLO|nr:hypothetical protein COHA_006864 [Chlorella ohadii]